MSVKTICVIGLGYIGLPTAAIFAASSYRVLGVDHKVSVVNCVSQGKPHIEEPHLSEMVQDSVSRGALRTSSEPDKADVYIIAVPTPIDKSNRGDLSFVAKAAKSIIPHIRPGNLVVLESTVSPGTTTGFLCPLLARSGLKIGQELFVAHCPERVLPGNIIHELKFNNRIIGGINEESSQIAQALYSSFVKGRIFITDATTAEMTKLMENTYRDVNIALANELAIVADRLGVDIWQAIKLANEHPRVNLHQPGPGVGGHCIAVDPWFIIEKASREAQLIHKARTINDSMPAYVLGLIKKYIPLGEKKVALLGLSYKGNVGDLRGSPSLTLAGLLVREGYKVACHDPHVSKKQARAALKNTETGSLARVLERASCVVVLTDHDQFKTLHPGIVGKLVKHKVVIDTRNIIQNEDLWQGEGFSLIKLGGGKKPEDFPRTLLRNI